ncbi:SWIRM domain-containing protein FUN19 [Physcia stellaris]|nr:SWIRM domain-containing protein FUN19 [Physcia stellaris]
MDSVTNPNKPSTSSNMTQLPSIRSLMSPPQASALRSPTSTPPSKSNRLASYSPENTLPPFSSRFTMDNILPAMEKDNIAPELVNKLLSPPVSPWAGKVTKEHNKQGDLALQEGPAINRRDPVLFPGNGPESHVQQALFPSVPFKKAVEDAISKHMADTVHKFSRKVKPPTREEYRFAVTCMPTIGRSYNKNPGAYMKRQREEEEELYRKTKRICAAPGQPKYQAIQPRPIAPRQPRQPRKRAISVEAAVTIDRPRRTPKPTPKVSPEVEDLEYPDKALPRTPGFKAFTKSLPKAKPVAQATINRSETPEVRAPVAKRDDKDYGSLPDYSPSLATLDDSPVGLKTDWTSNNPYNHSNDVDRHLLHPSEVKVAETLRLSCAQYLCSKRRIFEARLNALRVGKHFRKTDAQKACKIDVNKASKLFAAFEKVGWLDDSHFNKYL